MAKAAHGIQQQQKVSQQQAGDKGARAHAAEAGVHGNRSRVISPAGTCPMTAACLSALLELLHWAAHLAVHSCRPGCVVLEHGLQTSSPHDMCALTSETQLCVSTTLFRSVVRRYGLRIRLCLQCSEPEACVYVLESPREVYSPERPRDRPLRP